MLASLAHAFRLALISLVSLLGQPHRDYAISGGPGQRSTGAAGSPFLASEPLPSCEQITSANEGRILLGHLPTTHEKLASNIEHSSLDPAAENIAPELFLLQPIHDTPNGLRRADLTGKSLSIQQVAGLVLPEGFTIDQKPGSRLTSVGGYGKTGERLNIDLSPDFISREAQEHERNSIPGPPQLLNLDLDYPAWSLFDVMAPFLSRSNGEGAANRESSTNSLFPTSRSHQVSNGMGETIPVTYDNFDSAMRIVPAKIPDDRPQPSVRYANVSVQTDLECQRQLSLILQQSTSYGRLETPTVASPRGITQQGDVPDPDLETSSAFQKRRSFTAPSRGNLTSLRRSIAEARERAIFPTNRGPTSALSS